MNEIINLDNSLFNKEKIEIQRKSIADRIENGELDAIKVQQAIKFYESLFDGDDKKNNGLKHLIKGHVYTEFKKHGTKSVLLNGFKLEEAESGVKYDYSHDPVWNRINNEEIGVKERKKAREELLKTVKRPDSLKGEKAMCVVDEETGETYDLLPPKKEGQTIVKFTIQKS